MPGINRQHRRGPFRFCAVCNAGFQQRRPLVDQPCCSRVCAGALQRAREWKYGRGTMKALIRCAKCPALVFASAVEEHECMSGMIEMPRLSALGWVA